MILLIAYLSLLCFMFILGLILGIYAVRATIVNGIFRADIHSRDKDFVMEVLGIPNK